MIPTRGDESLAAPLMGCLYQQPVASSTSLWVWGSSGHFHPYSLGVPSTLISTLSLISVTVPREVSMMVVVSSTETDVVT
jgi:hypothetical protein